jgi:RNA polymerase sigma-70 factor, ECF subfamily
VSSTASSSEQLKSRRKTTSPDGAAAERQLGRWIAEGDEAALGELFDLLGPTLYALALGITQEPERAEAAIEETFAELWDRRASLGRLPALSPWILERCRTWAIALRTGAPPPPAPPLQDRAGDVPLTRRLLRCPPAVRAARVREALAQLAAAEQQAVVVAGQQAASLPEIARHLGCEVDAVASLLRSGLRQLRAVLERSVRRETL